MQILYDFQNDFLKMIKLGVSSPQKALEQINDLAIKLDAAIKGQDINSPRMAEIFLVVLNSIITHIGSLDENAAKSKFLELVRIREEKQAQELTSEQLEN